MCAAKVRAVHCCTEKRGEGAIEAAIMACYAALVRHSNKLGRSAIRLLVAEENIVQTFYVKLYLSNELSIVFKTEAAYGNQAEGYVFASITRAETFRLSKTDGRITRVLVVLGSAIVAYEYATQPFGFEDSEVYEVLKQ